MKRKFFFFDIDGTLRTTTDHQVPESYWKELCDGSRTYERTRV